MPLNDATVQGPYSAAQLNKLLKLKIIPGDCKVLVDLASLGSTSVFVKAKSLQPFLSNPECLSRGRAFLHEIQGQQVAPRAPEVRRAPPQPPGRGALQNGVPPQDGTLLPPPPCDHRRQPHGDNGVQRPGRSSRFGMQDASQRGGGARRQGRSEPQMPQSSGKAVVASGPELPSWRGRNGAWEGELSAQAMKCLPVVLRHDVRWLRSIFKTFAMNCILACAAYDVRCSSL
jgi:hypothetical protein